MPGTRRRTLDGWELYETGSEARNTALMLPGGLCSGRFYEEIANQPQLADVHVVATTLPGYAGTSPSGDLRIETLASQAGELAQMVGADVVVGHSIGANVAIEMVAARAFAGPVVLLAPSLYLLGPFTLLALLSRPRTPREFLWLTLAGVGVALSLTGDQTLVPQLLRTGGIVMSVAFVLLSLRSSPTLVTRILWALAITVAGLMIWGWVWGVSWAEVEQAFTQIMRDIYQAWAQSQPADTDMQLFLQQAQDAAPRIARVMPGLLAVQAMAGCALAWTWHHRVAAVPLGRSPGRFKDFRFNDHLVWGAIFTLGSLLLPLPPLARTIAANILIVWAGLYTVRGLAIIAAIFERAPTLLKILAMGLASPICAVLGLADTWLDFRGRIVPPASGGA